MKIAVLVGILSLALAASSYAAFRTPTKGDLERIDLMIWEGRQNDDGLPPVRARISRLKAAEARLKRKRVDERGVPELVAELAQVRKELDSVRETEREIVAARDAAYDRALGFVLDATMIADDWTQGVTYAKPFRGQNLPWKAVAGENEAIAWKDPDGLPIRFPKAVDPKTGKEPIAHTLANGLTVFHPRAFTNAEELILTVIHEQKHVIFNQDPRSKDTTAAEEEVECYSEEIAISEKIAWRDGTHKTDYLKALNTKLREKKTLAAEERTLKDAGKLIEVPNVERPPGLDVDMAPILARAMDIRMSLKTASVRSHLGTLSLMAGRECSGNPREVVTQEEFDALPRLQDRRLYRAELQRFPKTVTGCLEIRYLNYIRRLSASERIFPLPYALPPLESPFPPPTAPLPPPPGPEAPRVLVPYKGEEDLRQLIKEICANPYGFTRPPAWKFDWFPQRSVPLHLQRQGDQRCEEALGMHLMEQNQAGNKLDLNDLSQRAAVYNPPYRGSPSYPAPRPCLPGNPNTGIEGCIQPR